MVGRVVGIALLALCAAPHPWAQDSRRVQPGAAERRLALVIGNNAYRHVEQLRNAAADARAVAQALRDLGFEVASHQDLDRRGMNRALNDFVARLSSGAVAVIFYAGHGVQIRNSNYLLPVDVQPESEGDIVDDSLELSAALGRITDAQVAFSLAMIDACRNNPFRGGGRSVGGSRGLAAPTSTPKGFIVVYSAGTNEEALDRLGPGDSSSNGLFTRELLPLLRQPAISIAEAVRRLKGAVREKAKSIGREQNPAIYDQSTGDFYFSPPAEAGSTGTANAPASPARGSVTSEVTATNPLLAKWTGPYGGVPPFDTVKVEHFKPALETGMAEQLAEMDKITGDSAAPSFENTIAAMERAGRTLDRVGAVFGVFSSTMSTSEFQAVEREMAPRLAAFGDQITQNEKLFARIAAVYDARERSALSPEQARLVWLYYTNFVRAGARLDAVAKKRMSEVNQRLAVLYTSFTQNVLADETDYVLVLDKQAELAGLPASIRSAAAAAAEQRGHKGHWAVLNTRSSMDPFLTYSDRRDLREKVWRTYYSRGDNGDAKDNKAIISEILALRAERARLLGYATHAHWRLEDSMAKTPERAMALMEAVWTPAVARVREEVADMQAIADKAGAGIKIEPWDYRYYAEKVRKAKYDLDQNEVKPYLQLEKLREGMFWVAGELLGLRFKPVEGVPVCHPDVRVFEVTDAASRHVGLWYFDPYARPGKQSGAWMNAYRNQHRFDGEVTTIVSNNSNFVQGKPGEPILISWDDARTLFHEFGHALHGLSSNVSYPTLSGTNVARDYVEFPSQLLEHWLSTPEVLSRFALHDQTGKPLPQELVGKIERAATFNQGFTTVEYLASALVDMKLHLAGAQKIDPAAFERDTLKALGMPREIVMRHRTPQFSHVFAGDGYSAGYYSYLWSDTLSADAFGAFTEAGGPYDKAVAKRLRDYVFSVGNTVDPADAYRAFRGRDARIDALMRKRGFPVPEAKASR